MRGAKNAQASAQADRSGRCPLPRGPDVTLGAPGGGRASRFACPPYRDGHNLANAEKMRLESLIVLLIVCWFLAACASQVPSPVLTATAPPLQTIISPEPTVGASKLIVSATDTPMPRETPTPDTPIPSRTPQSSVTKTPTVLLTSVPTMTALPGLVYSDAKGQWITRANGQATLIITHTNAILSPNFQIAIFQDRQRDRNHFLTNLATGYVEVITQTLESIKWSADSRYLYYAISDESHQSDIWVQDMATHQKRNLSNTPDRDEWFISLWPGRPDILVFYSWPITMNQGLGEGWIGYLSLMSTDGTGYSVISNKPVSSPAAVSPDGQTIAFTTYEEENGSYYQVAWLYQFGSRARVFPQKVFGLADYKSVSLSSPAWSPDGKRIAWWTSSYDRRDPSMNGIAVFDLRSSTVKVLRYFSFPFSGGGSPPAPSWSVDGHWIAFYSAKDFSPFGIWLASTNGNEVQLVRLSQNYSTCDIAWSPDKKWIAFNCNDPALEPGV